MTLCYTAAMRNLILTAVLTASRMLGGCGNLAEFKALLDDVNSALLSIAVLDKANCHGCG